MTTRARQALADCEHALADFSAAGGSALQRTRWVAVITLLRTVGLVLKSVDRPVATLEIRERIDAAWERLRASKPEPRIFWEFIDAERNQVVHVYDVRTDIDVTLMPLPEPIGYFAMLADDDDAFDWSALTRYGFILRSGAFAGHNPLDLCREAIEFWRRSLDEIDSPPNN